MKVLPFRKMDAFARGLSSGNPAGYIFLESEAAITAAEMKRIAWELKGFVNEVGYLWPVGDGLGLKFYSAECEVDFCGHATIAIMYDLIQDNAKLMKEKKLAIYVNAGRLAVFNLISEEDAVYIASPPPRFIPCGLSAGDIAQALTIDGKWIDGNQPVQVVNAGLRTLLVPLVSLDTCLGVAPQQEKLRIFCADNDIDIVLVFCEETYSLSNQYRTRVFAPKYGYLEDPATGSGNAAFGHYLLRRGVWAGNLIIEQGPSRENPNIVKLRRLRSGDGDGILFGGAAVLRIKGHYFLPG